MALITQNSELRYSGPPNSYSPKKSKHIEGGSEDLTTTGLNTDSNNDGVPDNVDQGITFRTGTDPSNQSLGKGSTPSSFQTKYSNTHVNYPPNPTSVTGYGTEGLEGNPQERTKAGQLTEQAGVIAKTKGEDVKRVTGALASSRFVTNQGIIGFYNSLKSDNPLNSLVDTAAQASSTIAQTAAAGTGLRLINPRAVNNQYLQGGSRNVFFNSISNVTGVGAGSGINGASQALEFGRIETGSISSNFVNDNGQLKKGIKNSVIEGNDAFFGTFKFTEVENYKQPQDSSEASEKKNREKLTFPVNTVDTKAKKSSLVFLDSGSGEVKQEKLYESEHDRTPEEYSIKNTDTYIRTGLQHTHTGTGKIIIDSDSILSAFERPENQEQDPLFYGSIFDRVDQSNSNLEDYYPHELIGIQEVSSLLSGLKYTLVENNSGSIPITRNYRLPSNFVTYDSSSSDASIKSDIKAATISGSYIAGDIGSNRNSSKNGTDISDKSVTSSLETRKTSSEHDLEDVSTYIGDTVSKETPIPTPIIPVSQGKIKSNFITLDNGDNNSVVSYDGTSTANNTNKKNEESFLKELKYGIAKSSGKVQEGSVKLPELEDTVPSIGLRTKLVSTGTRTAASLDYIDVETIDSDIESIAYDDIIPFNIEIYNPQIPDKYSLIKLRAYLDSFSDGYAGSWNGTKYIGRAEQLYNYTGFDRNISFSFKVAALSKEELIPLYTKLNTLVGTTAASYDDEQNFMQGIFIKLTIGDYLKKVPGFFEKIDLSWKTEYPWELGLDTNSGKLPHVLDVSVGFKPIHKFNPKYGSKFIGAAKPIPNSNTKFEDSFDVGYLPNFDYIA